MDMLYEMLNSHFVQQSRITVVNNSQKDAPKRVRGGDVASSPHGVWRG